MGEPIDNSTTDTWRSLRGGAFWLILAAILVYLPALSGGFVWDDRVLITDNPLVKAGDGLYRIWTTLEVSEYYPLTASLRWLEWKWWGLSATGYHAVNILLHALNVVLVWIVLRRLKIPGAWFVSLVFAIHPVNASTVVWISEQKSTLSMFFFLASILWYLEFDEKREWLWYGLSLTAFVLALLSKPQVVMLPFVLLGCRWWMKKPIQMIDIRRTIPFFLLSLLFGLLTIRTRYNHALQVMAAESASFSVRLAVAGRAPWFYLSKALWPANLSMVYPKWEIDPTRWISYVPGLLLFAVFLVLWSKRKTWGRPLLFGFGYFLVMLFPVLGFFQQSFYRYSWVADHWQYYSIVGIIALVVAGVLEFGQHFNKDEQRRWETAADIAALAIVLALGSATWTRAGIYGSEETLWEDTIHQNPQAWMPHYNLGNAFLAEARFDKAIEELRAAEKLRPDLIEIHSNLGIALAQVDQLPEAATELERALQGNPDLFEVQANLGHVLVLLGRPSDAKAHWQEALRIKPGSAEVYYDLGRILEQEGDAKGAIEQYKLALKSRPDMVDAQNQLARLQRQGTSP